MTMTRRGFLSASAGFAAGSAVVGGAWSAPLPREADVVVIGAGAAGIAAARRIVAANRKVLVVEAANQIGGRCLTDLSTFDVPFDRGARWMHNPETSAMIKLARTVGLDVSPAPLGRKIRIGRRYARAGETEEFLAALVRTNRAIDEASRGKADVACTSALPKDLGDWLGTADFVLGAGGIFPRSTRRAGRTAAPRSDAARGWEPWSPSSASRFPFPSPRPSAASSGAIGM
jgi:phytoene dehydrogenase-like protein